ncbi:MAG: hypothetical protein QOE14_1122, partial [Humisphaera sp.]|nr:hypothetical protein [Humisphaera sp.]
MRKALFNLARMCLGIALLFVLAIGCEEATDPSLEAPDVEPPPAVQPATPTTVSGGAGGGQSPASYRKLAEDGDVPSMLLLGRSHESLGQSAEARKWYKRAADAGSEDGKKSLALLDAPPPPAATRPATSATDLAAGGSTTRPADPASSAGRRVPVPPPPPGDPGKLRWIDLAAILNYDDMVTDTRVVAVDPKKPPANASLKSQFIGLTTSRDGGITVAAMGPDEGELTEVTAVIRVRNRVDPATSPRVGQAGAVAARVTSDNVNLHEFVEWVTKYLQTEQRSEPIFRNGWRITISGSAAEGKRDP